MDAQDGHRSPPVYGVVVAAGRSERMEGVDKIFAPLMGRPLLAWSLRAFKLCDVIDAVVVVAAAASVERVERFVADWRFDRVRAVVPGGETRQDSVRIGIDQVSSPSLVAVHDAARPLVTPELIDRGIAIARATGAAVCAVPARDTLKEVDGDPPVVRATLDRTRVWQAQTPQVFDRDVLLRAHAQLRAHASAAAAATDDAALVEALGHEVRVYEGMAANLKVTTREDLLLAEALLRERFASA
jgi:2-C-methyl-D-erythritol 4-phosphate cytidylyltransferase